MITDRGIGRRVIRFLVAGPAIVALWLGVLVATTFAQPAGQAVAVFALRGRDAAIEAIGAAGGSVVDVRAAAAVARSDDPGFVGQLYRQGATLVVGAHGPTRCFNPALSEATA